MQTQRIFDASHRGTLRRAILAAEELTGGFYCIPGREWPRYPYDVSTLTQGEAPLESVFADLVRLVPAPEKARSGGASELYRIRLRDDRILSAVGSRSDGVRLYPLLLYVLTHELVHVVRFGSGVARFDADLADRSREEARVHGITREILRPPRDLGIDRVLDLYDPARRAADVCGGFSPK